MVVAKDNEILADDILRLDFFPVGCIMMYDGSSWQDNVTLKGWYKCTGQTVSINGTNKTMPDLRDKFLYFETNGVVATTGTNRENKMALTTANMPRHNHPKNFSASTETPSDHTHSITVSGADDRNFSNSNYENGMTDSDTGGYSGDMTTSSSGSHTHDLSENITVESIGSGQEFSIMPLCYKLIFIKKMI